MSCKSKLILVGDSVFAQVAYEFFEHDSEHEVVAFSVESNFRKQRTLFGLPVVPFEEIELHYPPGEHSLFVAIVFTQFNRLRTRLYREGKAMGYSMASYISTHAIVRPKSTLGEHCFICEDTVIQPFTEVAPNVVIWSGTQVCHRTRIGANSFILPNCMISDGVTIGENSIVGANVTVASDITIGRNCFVGPAMLVSEDITDGQVVEQVPTGTAPVLPLDDSAAAAWI